MKTKGVQFAMLAAIFLATLTAAPAMAQPPVKEEISRCHFCANPPVYLVAPQTP